MPEEVSDGFGEIARLYLEATIRKDFEAADRYKAAHERWTTMFNKGVLDYGQD